MLDQELIHIEKYIELYEKGIPLTKIKPLKNQTYRLFLSSKDDIRIVHRKHAYENAIYFKKIKNLVIDNEYFYMVPMTTVRGTIVGFIIRGVTKKTYATISREFTSWETKVPVMYGFNQDFLKYEEHCEKHGTALPLIVCEGSKDCMMLKKLYPYVVSINTSSMGANVHVLRNITDKFLLAYDRDEAGLEGMKRDAKILSLTLGAKVDRIELEEPFKDCADYFDDREAFKGLAEQIKRKLKGLCLG